MCYTEDGQILAFSDNVNRIQFWDMTGNCICSEYKPPKTLSGILFSSGGLLGILMVLREIAIIDIAGNVLYEYSQSRAIYQGLSFTLDGRYFAAQRDDSVIDIFDIESGRCTSHALELREHFPVMNGYREGLLLAGLGKGNIVRAVYAKIKKHNDQI